MDALQDTLTSAFAWAKEWQAMLAGLLVFGSALILARAILKAAEISASARQRSDTRERSQSDLRQAARPPGMPAVAAELIGALEQLRSMIRSALSSLTLGGEKENGPAYFLCQRITHLRLERFALPPNAARTTHEMRASLSEQLEALRQCLKTDAPPGEVSQILVQLNTSARNLASAVAAAPVKRQPSGSDPR